VDEAYLRGRRIGCHVGRRSQMATREAAHRTCRKHRRLLCTWALIRFMPRCQAMSSSWEAAPLSTVKGGVKGDHWGGEEGNQ
jgi:hypothetical protein